MHNILDAIRGAGVNFTSIRVIFIVLLNIWASLSVLEVLILDLGKSNHFD
jgi:hypothetical protein